MKTITGIAALALSVALLCACENRTAAQEAGSFTVGAAKSADAAKSGSATARPSNDAEQISSDFTLTMSDLRSMVAGMPRSIQSAILARPAEFLRDIRAILLEPSGYFVLVDKQHALAAGYAPPDLVNLHAQGISVARADLVFRGSVMPETLAMVKAARQAGIELVFTSTYRSYAVQKAVYEREVRLYGKKVADSESAVPGTSQHQLGDTVDFGCICDAFAKTADSAWLDQHAAEFGFSMTYPDGYETVTGYRYEPWHWHYITTAGTRAQSEFFDDIQQYLLVFLNDHRRRLVDSYLGGRLGEGWDAPSLSTPIGAAASGSAPTSPPAPSGASRAGSTSSSGSGRPPTSSR